jgi:phosphatidylserine/phosphatidylglycerophosphate/cardiolipin synthase-like enzyme
VQVRPARRVAAAGRGRRLPGRALIQLRTLTDGGQPALEIARLLASFLERAERSLDVALYDLRLGPETFELVCGTLAAAAKRGVDVRLLYNLDEPDKVLRARIPPPDTAPEQVESLPFPTVGIEGWPDLMHHKYIVRDGASVWSGSTNWTDDSWTREENVIATVDSEEIASRYAEDFAQLWELRSVRRSGRVKTEAVTVGDATVRTWFSPKRGGRLAHRIAHVIAAAERRVRIASPVLTSGPILGTVAEVLEDKKVDLAGVLDITQVEQVFEQWASSGTAWKSQALHSVLASARFSGKRSTPYTPDSVHDYMHAKVTVCDDTVFVGSFNLSHSGETNAENVLEIDDPTLAERMATFIDELRARYPVVAP